MGRKRLYTNDAERQRAFKQRKKEQQLIELFKVENASATLKGKEALEKYYPQYTFEQMKQAYEEYREYYQKKGFDVTIEGDIYYVEKHKKPTIEVNLEQLEKGTIVFSNSITLPEMENNMDNMVFNECEEHGYRFRYSIFLDYCPLCFRKFVKKSSKCLG